MEEKAKWRKHILALIRLFQMDMLLLEWLFEQVIEKSFVVSYLQLSMWIFFTALDGMKDPQLLISITSMQPVKFSTGPEIWQGGREGGRERKRSRERKRERVTYIISTMYYSCCKLIREYNQIGGLIWFIQYIGRN